MTLPGRQVPDCGPNLMFTDNEIDFLRDYAREHDMTPPERLGDAVRLVAHLGSYRDRRKHDPEPETSSCGTARPASRAPHSAIASSFWPARGTHCGRKTDPLQCKLIMIR